MKSRFALSEENLVRIVALLTAIMGVVNVLSAVTPSLKYRLRLLEQYSPFRVSVGGHLTSALAGFALILLSVSLWRRKQLGWLLTLTILLISIPIHLLKGLDYEEATLAALLAGLLIYLRPHFHARSDVPSVRQGLQILVASLVFTLAYSVLGFYMLDQHFKIRFGLWTAIRQTIVMFTEFYDPSLQTLPVTRFGRYFADSIYVIGAVTLGYALIMLLRPVLIRRVMSIEDISHAWAIVRMHGRTSLARYAVLDDKQFFFSSGGSLVSYVAENRVALALGDPIGPQEDVFSAIAEFHNFCSVRDWQAAFYQVMPDHLENYKSAGFGVLTVGQESIVNLSTFTLDGSENKTLRNSYNRIVRTGYHFDVVNPPYSRRMLHELKSISDDWLSSRATSEMRYSLGWFDETYLNTCPILTARDREGFIEAFVNIVTEFQANEVSVDLMRHRRQVEAGLMDFLFVSLLQWAKEEGYTTFNLGLSALSGVGEHSADPAIERALHYLYRNINHIYNFRGLHDFKQKFHPNSSPRYLIYPGTASLPAVGIALLNAILGGGLLRNIIPRN